MKIDPTINILVVEDDKVTRNFLKLILKKKGFKNVSSVNDSEQALLNLDNSIREKRPVDLLLVDWHTPNLEGIDLLKFVKGNDLLKIIPFIMITADGEKDHVQEAIIYGVDDYIVKPVIARLLISKIWKIMEAKYSI